MARSLFNVTRAGILIPGAPVLANATPVFPYRPTAIPGAVGDWIFGGGNDSLVPFAGSAILTPQSNTHTWLPNAVTTKAAGQALETSLMEPESFTAWACFQYRKPQPGNKNSLIFGNISAPLAGGGFALNNGFAGTLSIATYGATPTSTNLYDAAAPAQLNDGDWMVAVVSYDANTITTIATGTPAKTGNLNAVRVRHASNKIGVGNTKFTSDANYSRVDANIAMFGVVPRKMGNAEVTALYDTLAKRAAFRNIILGH